MYVQVQTSFGMKIQVQVKPKLQLYITLPESEKGTVRGLCGNYNDDTTDDFTASNNIRESSVQTFARSWTLGDCADGTPKPCSSDVEKVAQRDCDHLRDFGGVFAKCHDYVPREQYYEACVNILCNCDGKKECLCVALSNYAKACASQGITVGDWRKDMEDCMEPCDNGLQFGYDMRSCNSTCLSLTGSDPTCQVEDAPIEGCGCTDGTYLNSDNTCVPETECSCHYHGHTLTPGSHVIENRKCNCKDGKLTCSGEQKVCTKGKIFVQCYKSSKNPIQRKCDSLNTEFSTDKSCESGCYCPEGQYEDHNGFCVSPENCTCLYSGVVYTSGQSVTSTCQACTCKGGEWECVDKLCPGKCEVYGNGHYQTFDSKWYHFDGHCQYSLVQDNCGSGSGTFSVTAESVPCCDEKLTCSRRIILTLQGNVTLKLDDLEVIEYDNDTAPQYTVHTIGLHTVISVPSLDVSLIWDKHTRLSIILGERWKNKVCGLCGNYNNNEKDDLQIQGSMEKAGVLPAANSWKMPTPSCSDVVEEQFPCERFSYCSNWAERRCMILSSDIFKDCHTKVDYTPYFRACLKETCACNWGGPFLGFCTAVAAYAEACCEEGVSVKWRTPERCPVYCDYYNKQNQDSSDPTWHYELCGNPEIKTCGENKPFSRKLEGCYPRCPDDMPYFDENTRKCSKECWQTTTPEPTTTTVSPTTTPEPTTTVSPTTTPELTTTVSPTTTPEPTTTTVSPTTTPKPTTTVSPTPTPEPTTTTVSPTTTPEPTTTTVSPTTTPELTTTVSPTTTPEPTTTVSPTTTPEPTTTTVS
ncbi:hypothetical protein JZ751_003557, partial [Albula glossodonta]